MAELNGQVGELHFTVQVTRAATGETETHELVGRITQEQAEQLGIDTGAKPSEEQA